MGKIMTQTIFRNKTISSLYINNKEVQSIITNNNVVLYEKAVTPIPIPETITLNASKDIISYAHNESCTLTLQYPPGYTINIYNNSTNVLLGTMTDNNNNTYQYNYQATGNGDITFRAEVDNKSTTYTVLRKLISKGFVKNEETVVSVLIPKEKVLISESNQIVEESFSGSLPRFVAAFLGNKKTLSDEDADELMKLIKDHMKED